MPAPSPLRFRTRAEGAPTLLLIHGFAGHGDSWEDLVARLGGSRTLVTLDLPGHDSSFPVPPGAGFEDVLDRIAALVTENLPRPVHAVGYSLGARVALGLLVLRPELLESAVLVGVNPGIEDESARVRCSRPKQIMLPARGPLTGLAMRSREDRLFALDPSHDSAVDLEIAITSHL